MGKSLISVAIIFAVIVTASLAMLPPEEYVKLQEEAPVVVTGEVKSDGEVKETKDGEVRQFELDITEVERGELNTGDVIKVDYFVPAEPLDGPGGILGVTVGEKYKLWLQPAGDEGVYEGAAYASSIESLEE
ncbi:MAG: hypothetical protein GY771_06385 [bacterium]|nr:hypothetical protein [bacterium]